MWNKRTCQTGSCTYSEYLAEYSPPDRDGVTFPSLEEFKDIIKHLPNWKAAGVDGVFNFFIKHLPSLHEYLYDVVKGCCLEGIRQGDWVYEGRTFLIPKGTPTKGSDFRPITCMSNLYKLMTKCVTQVIRLEVEKRGLLSENQLGTVRHVQGAKELAMLNVSLNQEYGNNLLAAWIDVKKAFDSVDHEYLIDCLVKLNLPDWVVPFLRDTISRWQVEIVAGREVICS